MRTKSLHIALLCLLSGSASAQDQDPMQAFLEGLDFQTGSIEIAGGKVRFDLPEGWALLHSADARRVVEDLWGNPEDTTTLAFIDPPSGLGRLGSDYGVIVTLDESGHVKDGDAADIDYDELLTEMQADTRSVNKERVEAGYEAIDLVGWAEAPHYDAVEKKLHWAKELNFGEPENVLNYDVRVLGRRGYVMLQAVAPIQAISEVNDGMKTLLAQTSFTEGNRYADFDPGIDNVAAYGIGGLVAGKVLAKAGILAVIAKFGKLIVVAVIGAFMAAKKFLFGRSSADEEYDEDDLVEEGA